MKLNSRILVFLIAILGLTGCGGSSGGDGGGTDDTPVIPDPSAATLVFPENNTECNEGVVLNDSQSTVTFQWNASANTDTYLVRVTNLNTSQSVTTTTSTNEAAIIINRGTPYEWNVTSRANGNNTTAESATWRFYNEGLGVENYAPFPAGAVSPARGATIDTTTSVALEWLGSDVDNDIVSYEIFFGTETDPTTSLGTTSDTTINASAQADTVYYWKVVTTDSAGNTSTSEIFQFKVS